MKDIRTIIRGIARLKPFSQNLHQIMEMAQDPNVEMPRLADAIANDPILTANLLKDANSAYYGRSGKFETVHQAVVFLGTTEVFNLVLIAGCRDTLAMAQEGYGLQAGELWRYSLCSATMAKVVALKRNLADPRLVYTVGMVKDIGKAVLSQYVSEGYEKIQSLVGAGRHSFREAEREILGIDHAELGAMVAQVWQFSPKMVEMIRHHHHPLQCQVAVREAAAVYVGDLLCMMLGTGVGADGLAYRFEQQVIDLLQLSDKDIQMLLIEFEEQMDRLEGLLKSCDTMAAAG